MLHAEQFLKTHFLNVKGNLQSNGQGPKFKSRKHCIVQNIEAKIEDKGRNKAPQESAKKCRHFSRTPLWEPEPGFSWAAERVTRVKGWLDCCEVPGTGFSLNASRGTGHRDYPLDTWGKRNEESDQHANDESVVGVGWSSDGEPGMSHGNCGPQSLSVNASWLGGWRLVNRGTSLEAEESASLSFFICMPLWPWSPQQDKVSCLTAKIA